MLRAGCIVLSLWLALNALASCTILLSTLSGTGHTPALWAVLDEADVAGLQPPVLATIDSIAVFANGLNLAFCTVALLVVWFGLHRRARWAFWALLAGLGCAAFAGIAADQVVHGGVSSVSLTSLAIIASGLALAAAGLFPRSRNRDTE